MKNEFLELYINYSNKSSALLQSLIIVNQVCIEYCLEHDDLVKSIDALKKYINSSSLSNVNSPAIYREYQIGLLFVQLISEIEYYLLSIIKVVLKRHPQKIKDINFSLSEILQYQSQDEIIDKAVNKYLNEILYKKPNEYKLELIKIFSCNTNYLDEVWPEYVEMKARRDLGVHNNWKVNGIYLRKLQEINQISKLCDGELLSPTIEYFECSFNNGEKLAKLLYDHLIGKFN